MVNVGANSGSPASEQHIIDSIEFVNQIRPGQMQNYVWDTTTSAWIPEQAYSGEIIVVSLSGTSITASISGQPVFTYISGGSISITSGGLTLSGVVVHNYAYDWQISAWIPEPGFSGAIVSTVSGNIVWGYGTSGQMPVQTVSGSYVSMSGSVMWGTQTSGQVAVQTLSGSSILLAPNVMQFGWTSAKITAGNSSGILLSGGSVVSSFLTASAPTKIQSVEMFFYSGIASATQSGMLGSVLRIGAQGGISSTLVSAWFTSAFGAITYFPATPLFVLSGDSIIASITGLSSGNCSGMWSTTRIVLGA
jgi:hypothetical protein